MIRYTQHSTRTALVPTRWSAYSSAWVAIGGLSSDLCHRRRRLAVQERADFLKKFTRDLDKTVQVRHGSTIRACMTWI